MISQDRDFQYTLKVEGQDLLTGDAGSIGVVFANLHGRNFDDKLHPIEEHDGWLAYMMSVYSVPLPQGAQVQMLNPEGRQLQICHIGDGLKFQRAFDAVVEGLLGFYSDLRDSSLVYKLREQARADYQDTGNAQQDYEALRDAVEARIQAMGSDADSAPRPRI